MDANTYINGLTYDPRNVLVDNSEVPNYKREEGRLEADGTFLVVKRKQCSVANLNSSLTYIDSLSARLFPGAMVLCNSNLIDNKPSVVNVATKPVALTIDLPDIDGGFRVEGLTKSALDTGVGAKLKQWKSAHPAGTIAARVKYGLYEVKSQHKLEADLGFKLSSARQNFNIDFNAVTSGASREWVLKFEQVYYNVSLDTFTNPGDIIADSVTGEKLKECGVNNGSPIGIVHNVNYGRIVYVRFKTNDTSLDLSTKMNLVINGATKTDSTATAAMNTLKQQVSTDVFVYGGGTPAFTKVPRISIDTIHDFIAEGYNLDASQVAVPIGYSVVFMKNGGQDLAVVNSTSTYVETTVERHESATLNIEQNGWFVNHFRITWNEISYNNEGNVVVSQKSWGRNDQDSLLGQRFSLFFNGSVRNLYIKSWGKTGIVWDAWRTNFDKAVPLSKNMTLTISGTTLNQKASLSTS